MPDKKHVLSAIKFFNYVDKEYEEELANISKQLELLKETKESIEKRKKSRE